MRISEKTFELTLCAQFSALFDRWHWPHPLFDRNQPIWFGLTQSQEARAGFDAAARLRSNRLLLLQFKSGKRMKSGEVRFTAKHRQFLSLQKRLNGQRRLVYYVLPAVTQTRQLQSPPWLLSSTWLLDVGAIPNLGSPSRKSGDHHLTLDPTSGRIVITSDPVEAQSINAAEITQTLGWSSLGGRYESFDKFWSYAKSLGRGAIAAALPENA